MDNSQLVFGSGDRMEYNANKGFAMTRKDLIKLQEYLSNEVVRRRGLGGYSAEAEGILLALECNLKVVSHLIEQFPKTSKK